MGTKNTPGDYDCYANAEPDEPMFILLGRDTRAPSLVDEWADVSEARGTDPAKVAEARACADAMRRWRKDCAAESDVYFSLDGVNVSVAAFDVVATRGDAPRLAKAVPIGHLAWDTKPGSGHLLGYRLPEQVAANARAPSVVRFQRIAGTERIVTRIDASELVSLNGCLVARADQIPIGEYAWRVMPSQHDFLGQRLAETAP